MMGHAAAGLASTLWGVRCQRPFVLPSSVGGRNHLVALHSARGPVLLKLRADSTSTARREAWGLTHLPRGVGPRLHAHSSVARLMGTLAQRGEYPTMLTCDVPGGDVLLMERVRGTVLDAPSQDDIRAFGVLLARVHSVRASGPPLLVPSQPSQLLRMAEHGIREMGSLRMVNAVQLNALKKAHRAAQAHLDHAWKLHGFSAVKTLCHGDLRWHNALIDDGKLSLLDLEHAGVGDPAVDLALMAAHLPLSLSEELILLDAYLCHRRDNSFVDRYFTVRPLVALLAMTHAALDLHDVASGARPTLRGAAHHVDERFPRVLAQASTVLQMLTASKARTPALLPLRVPKRRKDTRVVAIDGTAASGKSVVARGVAQKLGLTHVNTGLMYRFVALHALKNGWLPTTDVPRMMTLLKKQKPIFTGQGTLLCNGVELLHALNVLPVERIVASWAVVPEIRVWVTRCVRPWLKKGALVLEGRDAGSVLAPHARPKVFVTADLTVRAERLADRAQLRLQVARKLIAARDHADATRTLAPMVKTQDARTLDTSDDAVPALVARVVGWT